MRYLIISLALIFFSNLSYAEQPINTDELCKAFIERHDDFKEISFDYCSPPNGKHHPRRCFQHNIEGVPTKFVSISTGGSCGSSAVVSLSNEGLPQSDHAEPQNSSVNGYGSGHNDIPLDYHGTLLLTNDDNSDLKLVTKEGSTVLCGFVYKLEGWREAKPTQNPICEKFAKEEYQILGEERDEGAEGLKEADSLYDGDLPSETHVSKISEIDLNGQKVLVLNLQFASGAGCGCDNESLAIAALEGASDSKIILDMQTAISDLTNAGGCNHDTNWSAITINGKGYIAQNVLPDTHPHPDLNAREFNDRVLYKYENKNFTEMCRLNPKGRLVIDRDVLPEASLDYNPIQ
jgi:hypothetical protein